MTLAVVFCSECSGLVFAISHLFSVTHRQQVQNVDPHIGYHLICCAIVYRKLVAVAFVMMWGHHQSVQLTTAAFFWKRNAIVSCKFILINTSLLKMYVAYGFQNMNVLEIKDAGLSCSTLSGKWLLLDSVCEIRRLFCWFKYLAIKQKWWSVIILGLVLVGREREWGVTGEQFWKLEQTRSMEM